MRPPTSLMSGRSEDSNMGFEIPKRTLDMTFKGTDYDGAEIKVRLDAPVGLLIEIQDLSDNPLKLYTKFGEALLLSWNLEEEGVAIPIGAEGMSAIPSALANIIINSWIEAASAVPAPLVGESDNGNMSEADRMRVAEASLNLGSYSGPSS